MVHNNTGIIEVLKLVIFPSDFFIYDNGLAVFSDLHSEFSTFTQKIRK